MTREQAKAALAGVQRWEAHEEYRMEQVMQHAHDGDWVDIDDVLALLEALPSEADANEYAQNGNYWASRAKRAEAELDGRKVKYETARGLFHSAQDPEAQWKARADGAVAETKAVLTRVPARLREAFVAGCEHADMKARTTGEDGCYERWESVAARRYPDPDSPEIRTARQGGYMGTSQMGAPDPAPKVAKPEQPVASDCKPVETDGHGFAVPHQETTLTTACIEDRSGEISFTDDEDEDIMADMDNLKDFFKGKFTHWGDAWDDLRTLAGRIEEQCKKTAVHVTAFLTLQARVAGIERRLERDADIMQVQRGMLNNLDGAVSEIKARVAKLEMREGAE